MMSKLAIVSPNAPKPPANFSHAIVTNGTIYVAGQGSRDPVTGEVVGTTMEEQIERTLMNIKGILETAGATMADVVSTMVYMKNAEDWDALTPVWSKWFPENPPVRATLVIKDFGRAGMLVEVVAIAVP